MYLAGQKIMNENEVKAFTEIGREVLNKGSYGIGWLVSHSPHRAAVDNLISDIEKCDLNAEEKALLIYHAKEIARGDANLADIVNIAKQHLNDNARPEEVDEDWQNMFLSGARGISSPEFKYIWGRILATECNTPGVITKSLLTVLQRMDKQDAEAFCALCNITVLVGGSGEPFIDFRQFHKYEKYGVTFEKINQLEALGLVRTDFSYISNGFEIEMSTEKELEEPVKAVYFAHTYIFPKEMNSIPVGMALFTKDGASLFAAVERHEEEGFWDETVVPWFYLHVKEWLKDQKKGK